MHRIMRNAFVLSLLFLITARADTAIIELYETSWHMFDDIFVTRPEEQAKSAIARLSRWSISGLAGLGSYFGSSIAIDYFQVPYLSASHTKTKIAAGVAAGSAALVINHLLYRHMVKNNERKALSWFLDKWPQHKKYTPESLKPAFDKLYNRYSKEELLGKSTDKAIQLIKENIYRCFPQKYKERLKKDFFDFRVFHVDLGNTLTGVANLIKVVKD